MPSSAGTSTTSTPAWVFWVVDAKSEVSRVSPPVPSLPSTLRTLLMAPVSLRSCPPKVTEAETFGWPMKAVPSSRKPMAQAVE